MSNTTYNDIPTLEQFGSMTEGELVAMTGYTPTVLGRMRVTVERDAQKPTSIPPCPPWCIYSAGHDYDCIDGEPADDAVITFSRFHATTAGGDIGIAVEEFNKSRVVAIGQPYVDIWIGGNQADSDGSTPDQAHEYARQLLNAADELERIQRDQATRVILDEQDAVADMDRP